MRFSILIIFLMFSVHGAYASEAVVLKGKCHSVTMVNHKNKNNNAYTICLENEKVSARMIFPNPGKFPAVCYQTGNVKASGKNKIQITLNKGYCDNPNGFSADVLECTTYDAGLIKCVSPHGKLVLKHVWSYK